MRTIATAALIAAAISTAPMAHASPSVGDVCYDWKANAQDANGQTLVCTHLPDSGHLMYWETHTESWYEGFHYHVSRSKTDPVTPNPQPVMTTRTGTRGWALAHRGPISPDLTTNPQQSPQR
jgi:hypothetical protein